ncbi:hypothetical protein AWH62_09960 [Maricaulis sp. W15]|uniref:c-type cytochrome n=1 Tax=Maricaulis sp. W15 TaxID=1772333 RepID=UPI00094907A6|nr:c-type cytochrome [Maricaulis sp. W15]OLF72168.1 hypothetical protein AWH62_09960 [Maricaulis sp. W15]
MTRALLTLLPAIALAACGGGNDTPSTNTNASSPTSNDAAATAGDTPPAASRDTAAILAELGGDYVNADLTNGARQFRRCQSCHTLNNGGRHTVGPNLHGIIGAPAAGADRFSYSSQLAEAGLVWDLDALDAWIANPRALVPGNRMSFVGLRDADDRRDVIAHIAVETADD